MDIAVIERRHEPRLPAAAFALSHATLRPGRAVQVVDLNGAGALLQTERPLRPGSRVHVRFVTAHRTLAVGALVLRCGVWALDPDDGVVYRGALRFDERCPGLWDRPAAGGPETRLLPDAVAL